MYRAFRNWYYYNLLIFISLFIGLLVIIISCSENSTIPPTEYSQKNIGELDTTFIINPSDVIIPLATGNTWVYVDSSFGPFGIEVQVDTVTIHSTNNIENKIWYETGGSPFYSYIRSSNDTIYELQSLTNPDRYISAEWLIPTTLDTMEYLRLVNGIALYNMYCIRKDSIYLIGNTKFSKYSVYWNNLSGEIRMIIVAPGIGIIETDHIINDLENVHKKKTLLSYKIIR